ncbi:MAG: M3 family oligoendopeptidase [Bacteroidetes bacterium]|nr:MAG: M3 family oligoendopeptidase [Bacteroidota bacterium]
MQQYLEVQDRKQARHFVPADFEISDWEGLRPFYEALLTEEPGDVEALKGLLARRNELDSIFWEEYAWRYIRMTCDTTDPDKQTAYSTFVQEIVPKQSEIADQLNRKIAGHPAFGELPAEPYLPYVRSLKREIDLFRKENIKLRAEEEPHGQVFRARTSQMSIEHEGQTLTMQQAGKFLESYDRAERQAVWEKMSARRAEDQDDLEAAFDQLVALRHQQAQNAGYASFTAYKFDLMGRFDYSLADTHAFHQAIEEVMRPVYEALMEERRQRLGVDTLRPWDLSVDIYGKTPLHPFETARELLGGSIDILSRLRPELGEMLRIMDREGFLDLDTRPGKSPGGYNYPLMETGIPFIFMNAAGTHTDVTTMLHESGHAIHAFVTRDLPLVELKQPPSEVAELASMTMELLALDHYDVFYADPVARTRAQKEQLLRCIVVLPWIATVDAFQQWVYDHPDHSREARYAAWRETYRRFHGDIVDWNGYEAYLDALWLKQGHIYEVPFYYIEYAIAQLGAIAIWRNYEQDPQAGLQAYLEALQMGYTRPIPQVYEAAGIAFDFSVEYVRECIDFCLTRFRQLSTEESPA